MWTLILRSSEGDPQEYALQPGSNTIGRRSDNHICISDISASRVHAEFIYDVAADTLTLQDLGSTNGTFVNREKITQPYSLQPKDIIRIGAYVIQVERTNPEEPTKQKSGTRPLTRELLLESLDQHAVLIYEVSRQLNTVLDLDSALKQVSTLVKRTLGADKCEVILADKFDHLTELGFPTSIAAMAIEEQSAIIIPDAESEKISDSTSLYRIRSALCVPVLSGEQVIGLIYMYKTDPSAAPFNQRDLQLAVAISHQAALTIQRMQLLDKVKEEQRIRQLLQRFLSPPEAEFILQDFIRTGRLPELAERKATVLFADIMDSTGLAERFGAQKFGKILSRYYQNLTDIIFEKGGMVDKYLGDGIMAIFGITDAKPLPEVRAVEAAVRIFDKLAEINREIAEPINIGIGINTGTVVAGYVGTQQRVELTILGDTVNVASRLQSQARPNRILVGPATVAAIVGHFQTQRIGAVNVKGRTKPIQVHEVVRTHAGG